MSIKKNLTLKRPTKEPTTTIAVLLVLIWLLIIYISSFLLANLDSEAIITNCLIYRLADVVANILPPLHESLKYVKTNHVHSKIVILIGMTGLLPVAAYQICYFRFGIKKVYRTWQKRNREAELFVVALGFIVVIATICGYYPRATFHRYGLNPEHSLFHQGLISFAFALIVYISFEMLVYYFYRNYLEKRGQNDNNLYS